MKKKLSLIPVLVLALTMMFGTVCVWGFDPGNINITRVEINLPDFQEGMTAEGLITSTEVKLYTGSLDSPVQVDYSKIANLTSENKISTYGDSGIQSYVGISGSDKLAPTVVISQGTEYWFTIPVVLTDVTHYAFGYDTNGDYTGDFVPNKSVSNEKKFVTYDDPRGCNLKVTFKYTYRNSSSPEPKKSEKKTEKKHSYVYYLPTDEASNVEKTESIIVDRDTFKSELPSKTFLAKKNDNDFADMKVHSVDDTTRTNQLLLMKNLVGENAVERLTTAIYAPGLGTGADNGQKRTLVWNDSTNSGIPGAAVYAVVYNQTDGAYVIRGTYTDRSTIVFPDFIYRDASTITIAVK